MGRTPKAPAKNGTASARTRWERLWGAKGASLPASLARQGLNAASALQALCSAGSGGGLKALARVQQPDPKPSPIKPGRRLVTTTTTGAGLVSWEAQGHEARAWYTVECAVTCADGLNHL